MRSTGTIGVVFSDLHNVLYADVLDGIADGLADGSEQLLLASGFHDPARERAAVEAFLSHRVDGMALLGSQLPVEEIQQLAREAPTVWPAAGCPAWTGSTVDDTAGAALATEHLIELGHRRIAHIDGGAARARRCVVRSSCHHASHRLAKGRTWWPAITPSGRPRPRARQLLPLAQPATAIFAANDLSALGVLAATRELRLTCPKPSRSWGSTTPQSPNTGVRRTLDDRLRPPRNGPTDTDLLNRRIADPTQPAQKITLTPTLITRTTTGPVQTR